MSNYDRKRFGQNMKVDVEQKVEVSIKDLLARREEKLVGSGSTVSGEVAGGAVAALDVKVDRLPDNARVPVDLVPEAVMPVIHTEVIAEEV